MASLKSHQFAVRQEGGCFTVFRDDEPLQTPRNLPVSLPSQKLAEAVAEECGKQGEKLDLRKMPLTQMTLTALDIATQHRKEVIDGVVRYAESELVCQRAPEPAELAAEQNRVWQPYVDWVKKEFGAELKVAQGIMPFQQNPEAIAALRAYVETLDAFRLIGLSETVGLVGSLVLGLSLFKGFAKPEDVFAAAELDAIWQGRKWGDDPVTRQRNNEIMQELAMCKTWLDLLAA